MRFCTTVSAIAILSASPAVAQSEAPQKEPEAEAETAASEADSKIVVRGKRVRGQLLVDHPPIVELDEAAIKSLGLDAISNLLGQLEPIAGGGADAEPILLVNGKRVGSIANINDYPPEVLAKAEVFPPEVALQLGYPANRPVINLVFKENYASTTVATSYDQPHQGGYSSVEQGALLLSIKKDRRISFGLRGNKQSMLTENERGVAPLIGGGRLIPGDPDPRDYRSLIGSSWGLSGQTSYAKTSSGLQFDAALSASVSGERRLNGLDTVLLTDPDGKTSLRTFNKSKPLQSNSQKALFNIGGSFQAGIAGFDVLVKTDVSHIRSRVLSDRRADTGDLVAAAASGQLGLADAIPALPDAGQDRSDTRQWVLNSIATGEAYPLTLPAGEVTASMELGYNWSRTEIEDSRVANRFVDLRGDLNAAFGVYVPIASRMTGAWEALGNLGASARLGINHRSDTGTMGDWSLGLSWSPFESLALSTTISRSEAAPEIEYLNDPRVENPNVPVFDYANGGSVLATEIEGGNAALVPETQWISKYSAQYQIPLKLNASLSIDYIVSQTENTIVSSPEFTRTFERAFPERVTRSASGRLLAIDRRPVALFEARSRAINIGLSSEGMLGSVPDPLQGDDPGAGNATLVHDENPRPRYFVTLTHSRTLADEVQLSANGPVVDQLLGDAITRGAIPQHNTRFQANLSYRGIGANLAGSYIGEAVLRGNDALATSTLLFHDNVKLDLRLFADLGKIVASKKLFKDLRLSLAIKNLFDSRRNVTDADGNVPEVYAPSRAASDGRFIGLSLRKQI